MEVFIKVSIQSSFMTLVDCEQSLFFFRFSESNARARERRSRETRETSAPSFTRVAICVSRVLHDGLQKKERLLVVYDSRGGQEIYMCLAPIFADSRINGGAKKLIKYPFVEIVYFSVHY